MFSIVLYTLVMILCLPGSLMGVEWLPEKKTIIPDRTEEKITIDGVLEEAIWQRPPLNHEFKTFSPVYGRNLGEQTRVWMAYSQNALYFAFQCLDGEPGKIKTSVTRRDNIINDDWIGVLIDAMGSKQTSYEFYVNPSGIQGDSLNSAVTGTDFAPDFVWHSAGKLTDKGYNLEIAIPLETLRFKSGKEVRMGILLLRNISHKGMAGSWPEVQPGETDFNFMAEVVYKDLKYGLKLELLPNFTASLDRERLDSGEWGNGEKTLNAGISVKYGINSAMTAEATFNPDFSQVESDAFQMEVNRRYPVFYGEKRPFFMEGMDIFDFGIINGGMMISSVNTRNIADPRWAAKFSGSAGKLNFALLTANEKKDTWGILRAKYNTGSDNSLGILYTGRFLNGAANNAAGLDFQYRPFKNARINAAYLLTTEKDPAGTDTQNGHGFNAMFTYLVPKFSFWTTYEWYDKGFAMESAFMNRTGLSRVQVYAGPDFYTKIKSIPWLLRVQPHIQYAGLHDLFTGMDDTHWRAGIDFYFPRRGFLKLQYRREQEAWAGQEFKQDLFYAYATAQLTKWFNIYAALRTGDLIYYDPDNPFLGSGSQYTMGITLQPGIKLNLGFEWLYDVLYKPRSNGSTGAEKWYSADILNLQATYQFNRFFFLRGAVRYDGFQEKILSDLLASFTLIPGTVVHLGYGSIQQKPSWNNYQDFTNVKDGLFLKISYLWQL